MTKIFYASTLFGAMTLAAAIDAGLFGAHDERWILLASTNTNAPEISDSFAASPAFAPLESRFDEVVRWNDVIAPLHPSAWTPQAGEVPMLSRLLLGRLAITTEITELIVESISVPPARTLGVLIRDCPITVYADGLMSYGPTREEVATEIGTRTGRVLYLDLAPGVEPVLLRENFATPTVVPDAAFLKVISELPPPEVGDAFGWPVIVGQYLAALGILSLAEENGSYAQMLRALAAAGHRDLVFAPHPSAGRLHVDPLRDVAREAGVALTIAPQGLPVEAWFAAAHPELVVSCFSTALFTAGRFFGIPAATMGTKLVLDRLKPLQNSNRIPVTLAAAAIAQLRPDGSRVPTERVDLNDLVRAVAYSMQPHRNPDLRPWDDATVTAVARLRLRIRSRTHGYGVRAWSVARRSSVRVVAALERKRAQLRR